jgi:molecular chaperone GrpE (heat shock protein)
VKEGLGYNLAPMQSPIEPKVPKWPFVAGDALLLGTAYFIYLQTKLPMGTWQLLFVVVCVAGGAMLCIMPFLLEYRLMSKLTDANTLTTAVSEIQKLEQLAGQIGSATGQWQGVQERADKTALLAQQISERMGTEVKDFTDFLQRANDSEKATLRLEVEKLRRAEGEWLQVLVRIMDHVHALHQGAVRSGQPRVIEQTGSFQMVCRDVIRRVGLVPYVAQTAEPFNAERHQLVDVDAKIQAGAAVEETIASGFTFQGKLIRPALVRLAVNGDTIGTGVVGAKQESNQSQLSLESSASR